MVKYGTALHCKRVHAHKGLGSHVHVFAHVPVRAHIDGPGSQKTTPLCASAQVGRVAAAGVSLPRDVAGSHMQHDMFLCLGAPVPGRKGLLVQSSPHL